MKFGEYLLEITDWRFKYASEFDVLDWVSKEVPNILPQDKWNFVDKPQDWIKTSELINKRGMFGEVRKLHFDKDRNTNMFGNYTMKKWYELLKDIATNGLREPVLISQDKSEIVEGNHRVQALYQLGYKMIPVRYDRS